jgi:hypothetical protein
MKGSLRPAEMRRYNARRMRAQRVYVVTGTAVAALAAACGAPHVPEVGGRPAAPAGEPRTEPAAPRAPWLGPAVRSGRSSDGNYLVRLRPRGGPIPKNQPFELEVWVFPAVAESSRPTQPVQPLTGVRVGVDARMPDHGHGMLRQPRVTDRGDGSHLVEGMLLHMGGFWLLTVDVYDGDRSERVKFELNL